MRVASSSAATRSSKTLVPIRSLSPGPTCLGPARRCSFTKVPLVEPRSCTVSAVPSHDSEAWEREASLSLRATSPSRPTVIVPARSNSLPASGPSTTAIRAPATDGTLQDPESELGVDPVHHRAQLAALTLDLRVL